MMDHWLLSGGAGLIIVCNFIIFLKYKLRKQKTMRNQCSPVLTQQSFPPSCEMEARTNEERQTAKPQCLPPVKAQTSNYINFITGWQQVQRYQLPGSFKLIKVIDKTAQAITGEYQWFNFPILSYSCEQLIEIASKIIQISGFQPFMTVKQTKDLVQAICGSYNNVSYHNFSHSFSLMHMLYQLTKLDPNFRKMYTEEEICYSLVAALAHDLNHPGTNNAFQVKTKSQRAILFENQSVLEKMHVKEFFDLLKDKNMDIFARSSNPQKMKQLIIQNIISTDISKHFKNFQKLKVLLSSQQKHQPEEEQRHFYMEQVFHACDIGNPCLTYQEYINWAALLTYQFHTQTLLEAENQVQVTEMLRYKSLKGFYQGQIGFINFLVFPLWKEMSNTWAGFAPLVQNIETNRKLLQIKADNAGDD